MKNPYVLVFLTQKKTHLNPGEQSTLVLKEPLCDPLLHFLYRSQQQKLRLIADGIEERGAENNVIFRYLSFDVYHHQSHEFSVCVRFFCFATVPLGHLSTMK
jgi:hypothetical protein